MLSSGDPLKKSNIPQFALDNLLRFLIKLINCVNYQAFFVLVVDEWLFLHRLNR